MGGEHAFGPEYNLLTAVVIEMAFFVHFVKIKFKMILVIIDSLWNLRWLDFLQSLRASLSNLKVLNFGVRGFTHNCSEKRMLFLLSWLHQVRDANTYLVVIGQRRVVFLF